jgi:hypothetical protein
MRVVTHDGDRPQAVHSLRPILVYKGVSYLHDLRSKRLACTQCNRTTRRRPSALERVSGYAHSYAEGCVMYQQLSSCLFSTLRPGSDGREHVRSLPSVYRSVATALQRLSSIDGQPADLNEVLP